MIKFIFVICNSSKEERKKLFLRDDLKIIGYGEVNKGIQYPEYYAISYHGIVHIFTEKGKKSKPFPFSK